METQALEVVNGPKPAAMVETVSVPGQPQGLALTSFDEVVRVSKALAQAEGFIPRHFVGKAPAIAACIMMGAEMGISPMRSLRQIYVVEGKPEASSELMLERMIAAGVRHEWLEASETCARIRLTRDGFAPYVHTFDEAKARTAGLWGKATHGKYPGVMLRHRCISEAKRAFCPDVMAGVYVQGEVGGPPPVVAEAYREERADRDETPSPAVAENTGRSSDETAWTAQAKTAEKPKPRSLTEESKLCRAKKGELAERIIELRSKLGWNDDDVVAAMGTGSFLDATLAQMSEAVATMEKHAAEMREPGED